jgi:hypothetical protein
MAPRAGQTVQKSSQQKKKLSQHTGVIESDSDRNSSEEAVSTTAKNKKGKSPAGRTGSIKTEKVSFRVSCLDIFLKDYCLGYL